MSSCPSGLFNSSIIRHVKLCSRIPTYNTDDQHVCTTYHRTPKNTHSFTIYIQVLNIRTYFSRKWTTSETVKPKSHTPYKHPIGRESRQNRGKPYIKLSRENPSQKHTCLPNLQPIREYDARDAIWRCHICGERGDSGWFTLLLAYCVGASGLGQDERGKPHNDESSLNTALSVAIGGTRKSSVGRAILSFKYKFQ